MDTRLLFNEVAEIIPGMAFRSIDADPKGFIPVMNASFVVAGAVLSDFSELPKINELPMRSPAVVEDGDLVMVSRSTPGSPFKVALIKTNAPVIATSSLYIIRPKSDLVSLEYLNYFLNSKIFQQEVIEKARGSTIAHISRRALDQIKIPIPNTSTQRAIVDLHNNIQVQGKIHQRQQLLKEQIIQATFTNLYK